MKLSDERLYILQNMYCSLCWVHPFLFAQNSTRRLSLLVWLYHLLAEKPVMLLYLLASHHFHWSCSLFIKLMPWLKTKYRASSEICFHIKNTSTQNKALIMIPWWSFISGIKVALAMPSAVDVQWNTFQKVSAWLHRYHDKSIAILSSQRWLFMLDFSKVGLNINITSRQAPERDEKLFSLEMTAA